jgi:hypothetical protein
VTITVEGADRLERTLDAAAGDLDDLSTPLRRVATNIAAATDPPRLTGALKASIRGTADAREAVVGSNLVYAPVQEYGWRAHNIRPHRFLSSAFAARSRDAVDELGDAVNEAISQVKGA